MTIRKIATVGHPVLRERAREVGRDELASPEIQTLIDDLIDTMRDASGAGIAANQVHEPVRIAVIEVDQVVTPTNLGNSRETANLDAMVLSRHCP